MVGTQSRMYSGSAMRPTPGGPKSKTKMHGKRPSATGKGARKGGYV